MKPRPVYEFGPFRLDPAERLLTREGTPVSLTPKAFETLLVLVERNGHLVEKDELMRQVWPDTFVEELGLARNVSSLRRALGEGPTDNRYIETVPKCGYRFVAPVRMLAEDELVFSRHIRAQIIREEEEEEEGCSAEARTVDTKTGLGYRVRRHLAFLLAGVSAFILLIVLGAMIVSRRNSSSTAEAIDSIAVLPFVNASSDPDVEYLSDGITENTINSLSQLPGLRVVPRTTMFRYKGRQVEPERIGEELEVRAVLLGRINKRGDDLSIQTELIDVARHSQLWGQQYDRKVSDLPSLQQQISQQLATSLRLKLTGEERSRLAKPSTEKPEAYHAYLKGRYFWNQRNEKGLKEAVEYFEEAIKIDPEYALAHSGLADSYTTLGYFSYLEPADTFPKAKAAAIKAVELDPTLAEPHTSWAYARLYYDWDWPGAEREFAEAISLNPNYSTAHHWYS
ncbi:MAG TPA: winged helix-turn-helix domain-containing protein, partial [Pyrinomonadaceae bacterium]|nr:winged helix-turn-helix domain-containing protein [Pyrinomonadaceae bacterium]